MIIFEEGLLFCFSESVSATCDNVNNKQVFPCHLPESSDSCGSFSNDPLVIHFGQNFRSKSGAVTGLAFVLNSCEEQRCNMETKRETINSNKIQTTPIYHHHNGIVHVLHINSINY